MPSIQESEKQWLEGQIDKLGIKKGDLQAGLDNLIHRKKFPPETVEKLTQSISIDPTAAIFEIANQLNPITISPRSAGSLPHAKKVIAAHISTSKEIQLQPASPLMPLGSAAHCLREFIDITPLEKIIKKSNHRLLINNNLVIGFEQVDQKNIAKQNSIPFPDTPNSNINDLQPLRKPVFFEIPLPSPKTQENLETWVVKQLSQALIDLKKFSPNRDWPTKPYDVEQILKNGVSKEALITIIEICHFVFADCGQMSSVETKNDHEQISIASIDQFRALNWLSIASTIASQHQEQERNHPDKAIFIELPVGKLPIQTDNPNQSELIINGGKIDSVILHFEGLESKLGKLCFSEICQAMESEFNSQVKRYHKTGPHGQKFNSELGRNLGNCFHLLRRYFGDNYVDHLVRITIKDYKFLAGDGGWQQAFNKNQLPVSEHETQIKNYLIFVLGQLYLANQSIVNSHKETGHQNPDIILPTSKDDTLIEIEKLLEFAQEKNLLSKITGQICYQIPGHELTIKVESSLADNWRQWGKKLIEDRIRTLPKYNKRRYLDIIRNALWPNEQLEIIRRESNKAPDSLSWCKYLHYNYLLIKEFSQEIFDLKKITINRTAIYKNGVTVFWLKLGTNQKIRLAINRQGKFTLTGLNEINGSLSGSISSNNDMAGVREQSEGVWKIIEQKILSRLNPNNTIYENQLDPSQKIIGPDGNVLNLVPGKPIVANVNPMTGAWLLNLKLLRELTQDGSIHTFYLHKLADILNQDHIREQSIMCPLPTHPNHNTKAAFIYQEGHIKCFGCGATIRFTDSSGRFTKHRPMEPGDTPIGYREVTAERQRSIKSFVDLITKLNQNPDVVNYLIFNRGLSPNDIGLENYAYYPPDLAIFISQIADYEFKKMGSLTNLENKLNKIDSEDKTNQLFHYIKGKHDLVRSVRRLVTSFPEFKNKITNINIENLSTLLKNTKITAKISLDNIKHQCFGYYVSRSPELNSIYQDLVARYPEIETNLDQLKMSQLEQWHQRGLIGKDKENFDYMSGRIIFKTQWISGPDLKSGNICARGITNLNNANLFQGPKHRKAFSGPFKKRGGHNLYVHPTPPGIWLPSPDTFIDSIATNKRIIFLEGPITTASFVNIFPEYRNITAALIGFPKLQLVALLKWFGVHGYDPKDQHFCKNLDIQEVVIGTDFDKGGANGFEYLSGYIKTIFPEIIITPIHDIIPDDHPTKKYLRPNDSNLYEEGGPFWKEIKIDWNDILMAQKGLKII